MRFNDFIIATAVVAGIFFGGSMFAEYVTAQDIVSTAGQYGVYR